MKKVFFNTGYFLNEVKTMIRLNFASTALTILSTGLIFYILAMIISGWWVSSHVVNVVQGEAEINVYLDEKILSSDTEVLRMMVDIQEIEGVRAARVVNKEEAYERMAEILGKEANVLGKFDENPFSEFIELNINLEEIDSVLERLNHLVGVEHIRENREVLDRLQHIAGVLKLIGFLIVIAVGISTLVIISHIIRLRISNNKEQINTLRLLGAPERFIALPFVLEGLALTLGGGLLAALLATFSIDYLYAQMAGPLPFIPLPPREDLIAGMVILVMALSAVLGVVGSLLGLPSAQNYR